MKPLQNNQKGQMALEMILMMVILTGFTMFIASEFKSNELVANIISKPWKSIAGMIENGVWDTPQNTMASHPGNLNSHLSIKGD